ncbi:hypothetical protein BKA69DRAFT_1077175 [Paraphysoderma sedebokerense]|nr:hypothetical protein BKA69DRAFT_1077175 [Paraphysoderma sedebokerense]
MSIFSRTLVHLSRRFASTSSVPPKTSLSSSEYFHSHLSPPPWLSNCLLSLANPSTSVPSFNIPGGTELIRIDSSEPTPPTHLKFPLPPQLSTKNVSADQNNKPQSMLINRKHYFTSILPTLLSESLSLDTPDPLYISLVQSLSQGFSDQPILQSYASSLITKHPTHLPSPLLTSLMYYYSSNSSSSLQSIALHSNAHPEFTPSLALQSWLLKVTGHDRETYLTPLNEALRTNVNCVFTLNLLIGSDKLWNNVLKDVINRAVKVQNGQDRQDPYLPRHS